MSLLTIQNIPNELLLPIIKQSDLNTVLCIDRLCNRFHNLLECYNVEIWFEVYLKYICNHYKEDVCQNIKNYMHDMEGDHIWYNIIGKNMVPAIEHIDSMYDVNVLYEYINKQSWKHLIGNNYKYNNYKIMYEILLAKLNTEKQNYNSEIDYKMRLATEYFDCNFVITDIIIEGINSKYTMHVNCINPSLFHSGIITKGIDKYAISVDDIKYTKSWFKSLFQTNTVQRVSNDSKIDIKLMLPVMYEKYNFIGTIKFRDFKHKKYDIRTNYVELSTQAKLPWEYEFGTSFSCGPGIDVVATITIKGRLK